jgi:hypothetical protein
MNIVIIFKKQSNVYISANVSGFTMGSLDTFLPASIEELAAFGETLAMCSSCYLEELPSLSPGKDFVKEVPSVFIIPGLQGPPSDVLKPLARQIMFPTICVMLPQTSGSLTETAELLVKVSYIVAMDIVRSTL